MIPATLNEALPTQLPQLLLKDTDIPRLQQLIQTDSTAANYWARLQQVGTQMLSAPVSERTLSGPGLLGVSRQVLDRVYTLGLLYRLDGQEQWRQRAIAELMAVAKFSDWYPTHWLGVAEMMHAVAVGYNWLYQDLTPDQRQTIKTALIDKGLKAAELAYANKLPWTVAKKNWNNVCNSGVILGALAVADQEPELAGRLLNQAIKSLEQGLSTYAPSGASEEGITYWAYATNYTVTALAALQTSLGSDFDLSKAPGLSLSGNFWLNSLGSSNQFFNYGNNHEEIRPEPALFWLAQRYNQPLLAHAVRTAWGNGSTPMPNQRARALAQALIWYTSTGTADLWQNQPLDAWYRSISVAHLRSAWQTPQAMYVGFKGGDNRFPHAHLDLGTFVLDALGERWVVDLGPDNYELPNYFTPERSNYYRLRTEGQNTLLLNGQNQDFQATAALLTLQSSAGQGLTVADLTAAYRATGALRVQRGVSLRENRQVVVIQDELELTTPADVVWTMHTKANIQINGNQAILSQGGQVLLAQLVGAPAGAFFAVEEVNLTQPQLPTTGIRKLLVKLPTKVTNLQLVIQFSTQLTTPALPIQPLANWVPTTQIQNIEGFDTANDWLTGFASPDLINGLGGNDQLRGGDGNDTLNGNNGNDNLNGGLGNDLITGGNNQDTLDGDSGNDNLTGGSGDDVLIGALGRDTLIGSTGNDTLIGGENADVIVSGQGQDILTGGAGADQFRLSQRPDSPEVITDFAVNQDIDRLMLKATTFKELRVGRLPQFQYGEGATLELASLAALQANTNLPSAAVLAVTSSADVQIFYDPDTTLSGNEITLAILQNQLITNISHFNFGAW